MDEGNFWRERWGLGVGKVVDMGEKPVPRAPGLGRGCYMSFGDWCLEPDGWMGFNTDELMGKQNKRSLECTFNAQATNQLFLSVNLTIMTTIKMSVTNDVADYPLQIITIIQIYHQPSTPKFSQTLSEKHMKTRQNAKSPPTPRPVDSVIKHPDHRHRNTTKQLPLLTQILKNPSDLYKNMRAFTVVAFLAIVAIALAQYNTGYTNTGTGYGTTGYGTGSNQYGTTAGYGYGNQRQYDYNSASSTGAAAALVTAVCAYAMLN
uniref:F5/8 type C domain-containing protein n=1 Tax=Panagrellus redivivus TaxID=6233 RepID=A0A7E4UTG3_PANRE